MNSTSRTRRARAPKHPPVLVSFDPPVDAYVAIARPSERTLGAPYTPPVPLQVDSAVLVDPYVAGDRPSEPSKRTPEPAADHAPMPAEGAVEMSPVWPLVWLFVPLILVIIYGALSTWLDF